MSSDIFRGAEKQIASAPQSIVKQRHHSLLQFGAHINHHVAARDQVQPGEGRIFDKTVVRENAELPHLAFHLIGAVLFDEEALESLRSLRSDMLPDALGAPAFASRFQSPVVNISGKDLDFGGGW